MTIRAAAATLATSVLVLAAGSAAHAGRDPEGDTHAKPGDDAGYHLGYPAPTLSWHGCTRTSSQVTPADQDEEDGVPAQPTRGNKQSKVTWTVTPSTTASSGYVVSWKVADGWTICGAQAAVLGRDPAQAFDLVMQTGYTSQRGKGSTVTSGAETIQVKVTKKQLQEEGRDPMYAGTYSIVKIYSLTVFIKKLIKKHR